MVCTPQMKTVPRSPDLYIAGCNIYRSAGRKTASFYHLHPLQRMIPEKLIETHLSQLILNLTPAPGLQLTGTLYPMVVDVLVKIIKAERRYTNRRTDDSVLAQALSSY